MLKISDLHLTLGSNSILNGIELHVKAGETVGIIGPNGSGKTTLFNCLSGFHRASSGQIDFEGVDLNQLSADRRAALGLGRIFQSFGVFKEMTVAENLLTALEGRDGIWRSLFAGTKHRSRHRAEISELLSQVGLSQRSKELASSLSGGQMRLLEIARMLAYGAKLFLLDEPTAGVSPKMKQQVVDLILKIQKLGKTVLVIEHDLGFIESFCQRIVVLDQGRVVLDGSPKQVRADEMLREIYFGPISEPNAESTEST